MVEAIANPMADRLRAVIARGELIKMPCCFDALSARLIEQAGFELTFLSGFGASASRIGAPGCRCGSSASAIRRKPAPASRPTSGGTQPRMPMLSAISMAGASSDQ